MGGCGGPASRLNESALAAIPDPIAGPPRGEVLLSYLCKRRTCYYGRYKDGVGEMIPDGGGLVVCSNEPRPYHLFPGYRITRLTNSIRQGCAKNGEHNHDDKKEHLFQGFTHTTTFWTRECTLADFITAVFTLGKVHQSLLLVSGMLPADITAWLRRTMPSQLTLYSYEEHLSLSFL